MIVLVIPGEMFLFTYQFLPPHLIYRVVSKDGIAGEPVPITMPSPVLMHDFAISENYACFMDLPLVLNPMVPIRHIRTLDQYLLFVSQVDLFAIA